MDILEILNRREDLNPELEQYREGTMLRHPLVYCTMWTPEQNAMLNMQLKVRADAITTALENEDYAGYVFMHEKPYRLQAFSDIDCNLHGAEFWELLHEVWTNSENCWQNKKEWASYFTGGRADLFMTDEDRAAFAAMPDDLTIYRGINDKGDPCGFSWTLDISVAEKFARAWRRNGEGGRLLHRVVKKSDVFAYTDRRNEKEIIYLKA